MGKIRHLFFVFVVFLLASNCFAEQISFQVVQHDKRFKEITDEVLSVEDELLTRFFEKGFIVTNSPAVISESKNQTDLLWSKGLGEAFEGSSDFFVQVNIYLEEIEESEIKKDVIINRVDWILANALNGETIESGSLKKVNNISNDIISKINNVIKA
ncbi:MAG: hypothetical protein J6R03_04165 [Treponema sp.]|jgi:hypothetical protein|nr:hypothetical protein [Treponema bryantii]MBO5825799.1 hypothetical protein [Treponema sp.]